MLEENLDGLNIWVKKTRPYRPQTNGKAERFKDTVTWAYALCHYERMAVLPIFLTHYNEHRNHGGIGNKSYTRMPGVIAGSPNIARESGNVGARSLGLTELWTESHSGLRLEGRASQAQRDPATNRTAAGHDEV